MRYLLDTHTLLWMRLSPSKLPRSHQEILASRGNQKFISTISIWEISLKFSLGKLELGGHTPEEFLKTALELGLQIAVPTPLEFASFHNLPAVEGHKDPFDRMLIWQAMQEKFVFLTSDGQLGGYKVHGLRLAEQQ